MLSPVNIPALQAATAQVKEASLARFLGKTLAALALFPTLRFDDARLFPQRFLVVWAIQYRTRTECIYPAIRGRWAITPLRYSHAVADFRCHE